MKVSFISLLHSFYANDRYNNIIKIVQDAVKQHKNVSSEYTK